MRILISQILIFLMTNQIPVFWFSFIKFSGSWFSGQRRFETILNPVSNMEMSSTEFKPPRLIEQIIPVDNPDVGECVTSENTVKTVEKPIENGDFLVQKQVIKRNIDMDVDVSLYSRLEEVGIEVSTIIICLPYLRWTKEQVL